MSVNKEPKYNNVNSINTKKQKKGKKKNSYTNELIKK